MAHHLCCLPWHTSHLQCLSKNIFTSSVSVKNLTFHLLYSNHSRANYSIIMTHQQLCTIYAHSLLFIQSICHTGDKIIHLKCRLNFFLSLFSFLPFLFYPSVYVSLSLSFYSLPPQPLISLLAFHYF